MNSTLSVGKYLANGKVVGLGPGDCRQFMVKVETTQVLRGYRWDGTCMYVCAYTHRGGERAAIGALSVLSSKYLALCCCCIRKIIFQKKDEVGNVNINPTHRQTD